MTPNTVWKVPPPVSAKAVDECKTHTLEREPTGGRVRPNGDGFGRRRQPGGGRHGGDFQGVGLQRRNDAVAALDTARGADHGRSGQRSGSRDGDPNSLDCLSELSGFAVWTCGGSTASALFELVSARGATAVHLWNGSVWIRYSMVDGAMVPGSRDFTVGESDIIYISN